MDNTQKDIGEQIISKLKELEEKLDKILEEEDGGKKFSDSYNSGN